MSDDVCARANSNITELCTLWQEQGTTRSRLQGSNGTSERMEASASGCADHSAAYEQAQGRAASRVRQCTWACNDDVAFELVTCESHRPCRLRQSLIYRKEGAWECQEGGADGRDE